MRELHVRDIQVISYSTDGSATERKATSDWFDKLPSTTWSIPHPLGQEQPAISVTLRSYGSRPIVGLQGCHHFGKTIRNNLFSGARLIVFGDKTVQYSQIRSIAKASDGLIYLRDVEKVDRQDDLAVARLFSASTLDYVTKKHPDWTGLIVFLFLFGEMKDAYLSRKTDNSMRLQATFRMMFVLQFWNGHLQRSEYSAQYKMSSQALEILQIIIDGFLALFLVHRQ